jgi:predicted GNAT family acetyltransferase
MVSSVRHAAERSRYELVEDGVVVGVADYSRRDGTWVFPHTEIVPTHRGRGLGAELVRGALDDVREAGGKVVPRCWYVAEFIDAHPDYRDMVSDSPA